MHDDYFYSTEGSYFRPLSSDNRRYVSDCWLMGDCDELEIREGRATGLTYVATGRYLQRERS